MKIYQIALGLLIFSAVATVFNEIDLFPVDILHTGAVVNHTDVNNIYEVTNTGKSGSEVQSQVTILDQIADLGGGLIFFVTLIWKTLSLALGLGGLISMYFPGTVGESLGTMITGITWFLYGWGGMQIFRKTSSKWMD